jgi:hypothetical protein
MDYHLPTVVKGDVEMPNEITADNRFRAKHTDDSCILSPICNDLITSERLLDYITGFSLN